MQALFSRWPSRGRAGAALTLALSLCKRGCLAGTSRLCKGPGLSQLCLVVALALVMATGCGRAAAGPGGEATRSTTNEELSPKQATEADTPASKRAPVPAPTSSIRGKDGMV